MEDEENQGNMLIGVLLGVFLQCLGIVIAFVMGGQKTLTGSIIGTVVAVLGWGCVFGGLGLLSVLLQQM
jgi:hypothetical protein